MEQKFLKEIIAISSVKGGSGKSVTAQNLASGLARSGYKVLVLDLDSNPCITSHMVNRPYEKTIADIFDAAISDAEPVDMNDLVVRSCVDDVDVIPGSPMMAITEIKLPGVMGCDFILKEAFESIKDQYNYIILDCPGSTSKLTANALVAADSVIIPLEATDDSLVVIKSMQSIVKGVKRENPDLKIKGFMLNKITKNVNSVKANIAKIRSKCDDVFITEIPSSCRAAEASDQHKSIFDIKGGDVIADAFGRLVNEMLELDMDNQTLKKTDNMIGL